MSLAVAMAAAAAAGAAVPPHSEWPTVGPASLAEAVSFMDTVLKGEGGLSAALAALEKVQAFVPPPPFATLEAEDEEEEEEEEEEKPKRRAAARKPAAKKPAAAKKSPAAPRARAGAGTAKPRAPRKKAAAADEDGDDEDGAAPAAKRARLAKPLEIIEAAMKAYKWWEVRADGAAADDLAPTPLNRTRSRRVASLPAGGSAAQGREVAAHGALRRALPAGLRAAPCEDAV